MCFNSQRTACHREWDSGELLALNVLMRVAIAAINRTDLAALTKPVQLCDLSLDADDAATDQNFPLARC